MQVQSVSNQSFKGIQCYPTYKDVQFYLAKQMSADGFVKTMNCIDKLAKNKALSEIYLGGDLENPRLIIEIGNKVLKESFFSSPLRIAKKALKISNNMDAEEKAGSLKSVIA